MATAGRQTPRSCIARWGERYSFLLSGGLLVVSGLMLIMPGNLPMAIAAFTLSGFGVAGVIGAILGGFIWHSRSAARWWGGWRK